MARLAVQLAVADGVSAAILPIGWQYGAAKGDSMHITIDRSSPLPVYLQIRNQIREMILSARLPVGFRLPPERRLAETLGVNRSTVVSAYRELEADALIRSHVGRGTVVHPWAPEGGLEAIPQVNPMPWHQLFREGVATSPDPLTRDLLEIAGRSDIISFAAGVAAPDLYPMDALRKIQDELMVDRFRAALQHSPTEEHRPLRESISRLLGSWRSTCEGCGGSTLAARGR